MHKLEVVNRSCIDDNLFTKDNEIFISKSPFSAFENIEADELVFRGKKTFVNVERIMLQVQMGYIKIKDGDTIDLEILKALNELEFATSRMVTVYLNLKGIDVHQKQISKRLRYLNNQRVLSSYEFKSKDQDGNERISPVPIFYLDTIASVLLRSQDIPSRFDLETALRSKDGIKETLARNQLMLIYWTKITNIEYSKNNPSYNLRDGSMLEPHLQVVLDYEQKNHHMFFEVVRSFEGWENKLLNRLDKYTLFYEQFSPSKTIPFAPLFVFLAEDDVHAVSTMKLILNNDIVFKNQEFIFTTDTRILGDSFSKSLFRFTLEGNVAHLTTVTNSLFVLD